MASLVRRFDPFREMEDMMRGLVFKPVMSAVMSDEQAPLTIKIDASEDDKSYSIDADIPGVKKEDIKVSIEGNEVSISAEVKQEKEEKKDERVLRTERYYGQVYRSFTLPQQVDETGAQAKYENGVLRLTLPKRNNGTRFKNIIVT